MQKSIGTLMILCLLLDLIVNPLRAEDKSKWPFAKDIYIWEEWPVRQSCLLFAGIAYENEQYIQTYLRLPSNPAHPEVIRNLPVRHPVIWLK